jgi:hypothetical protein
MLLGKSGHQVQMRLGCLESMVGLLKQVLIQLHNSSRSCMRS